MRTALTIAGSDSSGGAGIQADLKTFAAFGVYGTSAITAITAQNTIGITAALTLPADLVTAQIEAVAGDITIHATKIGMLATAAIVEAVIHDMGAVNVIVTGGHGGGDDIVDLLFDGHTFTELHTPRVATLHTHGTGCTFASAVAACLALGHQPAEAAGRAQRYVTDAIRHAPGIGHGHGPLDHFWGGILKG